MARAVAFSDSKNNPVPPYPGDTGPLKGDTTAYKLFVEFKRGEIKPGSRIL